jgi:hypothetical protein
MGTMPGQPTPLDAAELARRYEAGESLRALAAAHGVSASSISKLLTTAGCRRRGRGGAWPSAKHPGEERLRELHIERELPAAEIAALLGVGPSTVAKWLRRAGIARDRLAARRLVQRRRSAS